MDIKTFSIEYLKISISVELTFFWSILQKVIGRFGFMGEI